MSRFLNWLKAFFRGELIELAAMILLFVLGGIFIALNIMMIHGKANQEEIFVLQEATLVIAFPVIWIASKWDLRKERAGNPRRILFERVVIFLMWGVILFGSYLYVKPTKLQRDKWTRFYLWKGVSFPENDAKFLGLLAGCIGIITKWGKDEMRSNVTRFMLIIPAFLMLSAIMMVVENVFFQTTVFEASFTTSLLSFSIGISTIIFGIGRERIYSQNPVRVEGGEAV